MQIQELYEQLERAYSQENLNTISSGIITLYRNRDESGLRSIYAMINNGNRGADEKLSRIFTRIITQYHPDRQEQINKDMKGFLESNDMEGLKRFDHILDVQNMDLNGHDVINAESDFDFGDIWDYTAQGYSYIDDEERDAEEYDPYAEMIMNHGFMAAVKRKIYGHLHVDFPSHLLADMEIIEMAEYEIENLDGVEYCTYCRIIDLSGNNLTDASPLAQLLRLEEIFLQNNHLTYVDGLNELPYLRILDLSHNDIDDVTPLFDLDSLEFLNVIGNRIPGWQLEKLSLNGVIVVA